MQLDTLTISERLHKAGLPQKVAKEWASIWHEDVTDRLATKEDLDTLELALRKDMESMETSLRKDMESMGTSLRKDVESIRKDMESLEERLDQKLESMEVRLDNRMLRHTYSAVGILGLLMIVLRFIEPLKTMVAG